MHIADLQVGGSSVRGGEVWRRGDFFARVSFCWRFIRAGLGNSQGDGQPTDGFCGRPGWRPEQLLGLARAPRNRLLSIHLRTINDVAGVMPDVG